MTVKCKLRFDWQITDYEGSLRDQWSASDYVIHCQGNLTLMCELHFIRFARLGYFIRFRNVWLFSYSLSTIVYLF